MQPQGWQMQQGYEGDAAGVAFAVFIFLFSIAVSLVISAVVALLIYLPYSKVPEEHRKMPPAHVFLLVIPLLNLIWNFFVFLRVPESFESFFRSRGRHEVGDAGRMIGLWYAICAVVSFIPCLNIIAGPASLVLLIIFLVRIWQMAGQVPQLAALPPAGPRTAPPTATP